MRNERKADIAFALTAVLFALVFWWRLHDDRMGVTILYFLAQSAFIGSAADWFAVTALFKRPLGFPFHTALIPSHREKIIGSIRKVIESRLVRPEAWSQMIKQISITGYAGEKLQERNGQSRFTMWCAERIAEEAAQWLEENRDFIAIKTENWMLPFSEWAPSIICDAVLEADRQEKVLLWVLDKGESWAEQDETVSQIEKYLKQFVHDKKGNPLVDMAISIGESIGLIHYRDMAESIQHSLREECHAWKSMEHPMHVKLKNKLSMIMKDCIDDPATIQILKEEKNRLQEVMPVQEWGRFMMEQLAEEWFHGNHLKERAVPLIQKMVSQGIDVLFQEKALCQRIDHLFQVFLKETALYAHSFIGETAEAVLNAYNTDKLNAFIHSKVHEELGWIRINGALVAAGAGLFLYTAIELLWRPLIGG